LFKLKNREDFEGGLKNWKNLKKPVIKVSKNREEFRQGGGNNFSGWPDYIPLKKI